MGLKNEIGRAWDEVLSPLFEEFSVDVAVELLDVGATALDPVYATPS